MESVWSISKLSTESVVSRRELLCELCSRRRRDETVYETVSSRRRCVLGISMLVADQKQEHSSSFSGRTFVGRFASMSVLSSSSGVARHLTWGWGQAWQGYISGVHFQKCSILALFLHIKY